MYVTPENRVVLDSFALDKSLLTDSHAGKIAAIARHHVAMTKSVGAPLKIGLTGHTDSRGKERHNAGLAERRAAAVDQALRKAIDALAPGLSGQMSITRQSFGESRPLVKARTEAEHARNRRVEVQLEQRPRRCPRASLRAVVGRTLKLLPRLGSPDQAQRIGCMLRKVLRNGADDRWVFPQLVLDVEAKSVPFGTYPFALVRDYLSVLGTSASDAAVLKSLESLDAQIVDGIKTVARRIAVLSGAASAGVPLVGTAKAVDALRGWMHARRQDDASIYSCYRNV
jgi:hypothetical protein